MALPTRPTSSWLQDFGVPSDTFEPFRTDHELYEEDDEFVLSVELPGFDPDDIAVSWDEGVLNVAADHEDDERGQYETFHRRFRFPKSIDESAITAEYNNGILEVRLPVDAETPVRGREIEVEA